MLQITCAGTPHEIGLQHGRAARAEIQRGIEFYRAYYVEKASLQWEDAVKVAVKFLPLLNGWGNGEMVEEMRGIAEGAGVAFEDILALNVRSEISMGMMIQTDGCTALSYTSPVKSFLAQNWDWDPRQKSNLIAITIKQSSLNLPSISQITEAGLIGKIGLNSSGVGVCLNAIRTPGVDFSRLPIHIALRTALNCTSANEALSTLQKVGIASACHILIADPSGGTSTEWSSLHSQIIPSQNGILAHTNHFLVPPPARVNEISLVADSPDRMRRITDLLDREVHKAGSTVQAMTAEDVERILDDEEGFPCSINRSAGKGSDLETLFSIVMDLRKKEARVRVGRPTEGGERVTLKL